MRMIVVPIYEPVTVPWLEYCQEIQNVVFGAPVKTQPLPPLCRKHFLWETCSLEFTPVKLDETEVKDCEIQNLRDRKLRTGLTKGLNRRPSGTLQCSSL